MKKKGSKSERIESAENLGDLNPRYYEEGMSPENALEKVHSMNGIGYSVRPY